MPITRTETVEYKLVRVSLNLDLGSATATLRQSIAGVPVGEIPLEINGQDLLSLLGSTPDGTLTLADSFNKSVYDFAIAKGYVTGTVS